MSSYDRHSDLYSIGANILAIGELIRFRGGEPSLDEESVNYGIGEILTDLAQQIELESSKKETPSGME